jgi:hypothetical protein
MKYIYLSIFLCLLISFTICDNTSFLKRVAKRNSTQDSGEPEPKAYNGYCFIKMKNQFYNLHPFDSLKPWKLKAKKGDQVQFNFCSDIDTSCKHEDALIADPKNCKRFSGKHDEEKTWTLSKDKKKNSVLSIRFPAGDSCGSGKNYTTTVELTCDAKVNTPQVTNNNSFDESQCENVIRITSKHGKHFSIL